MQLKKYHITTFGCQANLADSERIAGVLESIGLRMATKKEEADIIIFNTCSVKQKAEDRIFGLNNEIINLKSKNKKLKVILTGCMMHYSQKELAKRMPFIDIFLDITKISQLPQLLNFNEHSVSIKKDYLNLMPKYSSKISASIPISFGCNNFCTYCIVPYSRKREYSRPVKDIVKEVETLIKNDYKEIWLLGQNVNSYKDKNINFPELLRIINDIPGDFWIRFTSPHPKDFSSDLIKTIKECGKITKYIHLPIQSGDDKILKKMNRPYTISQYKTLVKKIKKEIPEVTISTDIIVGFPSETKKQFENTAKIMREIEFDQAFISEYSPRPKTIAAITMKDDVPQKEKVLRKKILNDILIKTLTKNNKKLIGKTLRVLIDNKKNGKILGRTDGNKLIELSGENLNVGEFVNAKITEAKIWNIKGEIKQNKIIVVLGPTSSGKSDLAVKIAKKYNGEIISADSRQVYKEINIGTGKITRKEMCRIPHHCIDVVSVKKRFSVIDFKKCAGEAIKNILSRGKTPIICGGTGFYIQSIVDNITIPEVAQNWKLRKELEKKTTEQLFKILQKLNPKRAETIDAKNPRRLIRAIEIAKSYQLSAISLHPSEAESRKLKAESYNFLQIGIKLPEKELKDNIEKRVKKMIKLGLIKETENLKKLGLSWKKIYELGFEYKYPAMFLQNKITKDDMVNRMILENEHYAKRQYTWFKRDKRINWITNTKPPIKLLGV